MNERKIVSHTNIHVPVLGSDREEMQLNRTHTTSLKLLRKIAEDLGHNPFTLEDIRDAYNPFVKVLSVKNRTKHDGFDTIEVSFGKANLAYLVDNGFLVMDEDGSYCLNPDNHAIDYLMYCGSGKHYLEDDYSDESSPLIKYRR
tara:strand:+ start:122 stop:553 length:432 start_codon:yes stop_codon:yes gene_type:complete